MDDAAFWEHVMVVPFRSKFVPAKEIDDAAKPYTFPVVRFTSV